MNIDWQQATWTGNTKAYVESGQMWIMLNCATHYKTLFTSH